MANRYPQELRGLRGTVRIDSAELPVGIGGFRPEACTQTPSGCQPSVTVTVMMPSELQAHSGRSGTLRFYKDGAELASIPVNIAGDQLHIMNACDKTSVWMGVFYDVPEGACAPALTHGNGRRVTAEDPATPGETLVVWVFGGGALNPGAVTGPIGEMRDGLLFTPRVHFDFRENAAPVRAPFGNGPTTEVTSAVGVGPTGMAQINFVVPPIPAGVTLPACGGSVASNAAVSLIGPNSQDGARFCVRP